MRDKNRLHLECPMCTNTEEFRIFRFIPHIVETRVCGGSAVRELKEDGKSFNVTVDGIIMVTLCSRCGYRGQVETFGNPDVESSIIEFLGSSAKATRSCSMSGVTLFVCAVLEDPREADALVSLESIKRATLSELPEFLVHEHPAVRKAAAKIYEAMCVGRLCLK